MLDNIQLLTAVPRHAGYVVKHRGGMAKAATMREQRGIGRGEEGGGDVDPQKSSLRAPKEVALYRSTDGRSWPDFLAEQINTALVVGYTPPGSQNLVKSKLKYVRK